GGGNGMGSYADYGRRDDVPDGHSRELSARLATPRQRSRNAARRCVSKRRESSAGGDCRGVFLPGAEATGGSGSDRRGWRTASVAGVALQLRGALRNVTNVRREAGRGRCANQGSGASPLNVDPDR